jgi:hypothetical protein
MTNRNGKFIDEAGNEVLRFISATRNLSRIGELADEVVRIAKSKSWRHYRDAVGEYDWREAEFDYFLMSCDLRHEDIGRVVLHTQDWSTLAQIMDPNADVSRRRPLEEAAASWRSASQETLIQRAQRLGWTKAPDSPKLRAAPLPPRRNLYNAQNNGKSQEAMLRRLARNRPDLYQRVLNSELSPYTAMRAGGLLPKQITVNTEPEKAAQTLRRHFDEESLRRLVELLSD